MVAKYTVKKLKRGKFYIVPGIDIQFLRMFSKIIPSSVLTKIIYYQQKKKKDV